MTTLPPRQSAPGTAARNPHGGLAFDADTKSVERIALVYVEMCGKLAALVEWIVAHEGECLADNPHQLRMANRYLAEVVAIRNGEMP